MAYLLDTNAVIALMKNHPRVVEHIRQLGRSELVICAPVEAELWFGVNKSNRVEENRRHLLSLLEWLPSLSFSGDATRLCGEIRAKLAQQGTPIGPYDLQIAAIALANDCVLVTHNTGEFSRITGLKLEDWEVGK
jgi:tRNA(fMet)-specific endonuclease VapC